MAMMLVMASTVMAGTVTNTNVTHRYIDEPDSADTMDGSFKMNVTFGYAGGEPGQANVTSMNWSYTPAGGSETWIVANTTNNGSVSGVNNSYAYVFASGALFDSTTYTITARLYNESETVAANLVCTATSTLVLVDNQDPVCTITAPTDNLEINPEDTWTVSVTATNSSTCHVIVNGKNWVGEYTTATVGSEVCEYTFDAYDVPEGSYDVSVIAEDQNADQTTCTTVRVELDTEMPSVRGAIIDAEEAGYDFEDGPVNMNAILVIVIVGLGIYWYTNNKRK